MKSKEKIISFPISISDDIYLKLEKYKNIGWIYNPYGNCWTHYFKTKKNRSKFIKYVLKLSNKKVVVK